MHCSPAPCSSKSVFAKHRQHRGVLGQNLGNQSLKPVVARDHDKVPKQPRSNALPLIFIDDREGQFGGTLLRDDVTPAADDRVVATFVDHSHECDVPDEIDIDEKIYLGLGESPLRAKEATIE